MNKGGKSLSDLLRLVSFGLRGASCKADQTSFYMIQKNTDDLTRQDYFCNSGSICYGMVERKMTNSIEKRQRKPGDLRVKDRRDRRVRAIC